MERGNYINELANMAKKVHSERAGDFYKDPNPEVKTINDAKLVSETSEYFLN